MSTKWENELVDNLNRGYKLQTPEVTMEDLAIGAIGELNSRLGGIESKQAADKVRFDSMGKRLDRIDNRLDRVGEKVDEIRTNVGEMGGMLKEMNVRGKALVSERDELHAPTSGPAYYFAIFLKYGGKTAVRWVGIVSVGLGLIWLVKQLNLI